MSKMQLELWLDESGDFQNDSNINKSPSLVGGVLIEKNKLDTPKIIEILGSEYIHSNEMGKENFGAYATELLQAIINHGGQLIIYENQERLEIIDGTITYLNIISEGIIQLLQLLMAEYEEIDLSIVVAVRLDMEKQDTMPGGIIPYQEYVMRLNEKIMIGLARRAIANHKCWKWDIRLASARNDQRLMLADVVCNSWLTQRSKKFTIEQRELLQKLYVDKYRFSVFEKSTPAYIKRLIAEGDFAEAIFEVYTSEEKALRNDLLEIIMKRLLTINSEGVRIQLINLKTKIDGLIKIENNLSKSKLLLQEIQNDFIVRMVNSGIDPGIFALDIYLYLFTVHTHEGNIAEAERLISLCEKAIKNLSNRWEGIDYFFMYKIRKAVYQINCFDYYSVCTEMSQIVNTLKETMEIFSIIDGLDNLYHSVKSDALGKALGTRLQAYCFMLRKDAGLYEAAIEDSRNALQEFLFDTDISRQYQYRAQIECEAGHYTEALRYLLKVEEIELEGEDSILQFLSIVSQKQPGVVAFSMMHYTRIMAEAAINREMELADLLYSSLNKQSNLYESIVHSNMVDHPYEIIAWKLATYHGLKGNITASMKAYDQAIEICFCRPERWTFLAIGLGVIAEKTSILYMHSEKYDREANLSLKEFTRKYESFMKLDLPGSMRDYFVGWKKDIETVMNSKDVNIKNHMLWKLSREITY